MMVASVPPDMNTFLISTAYKGLMPEHYKLDDSPVHIPEFFVSFKQKNECQCIVFLF